MPPLKDASDVEVEYSVGGEVLMSRRALNMQCKVKDEVHKENIFHTCYHVENKVCTLIINGKSCANVSSTELVEKLDLSTLKHLRPYKLQWLNDCKEIKVNKQLIMVLPIGKYHNEILCDVVPMHVGHILLGRL